MKKASTLQIYGYWGVLKLSLNLIRSKLFIPNARLIRFPIEIRGKKHINFGTNLTTGVGCRIEAFPFVMEGTIVKFGDNIEINDYVHIAAIKSVKIGNNVLLASKVYISDIKHGCYSGDAQDNPEIPPRDRLLTAKEVIIEDNVWIGEFVSVLPGVTIGKGSIVGANSVVSKSLPPNVIAVGSPAKPIKKYNFETQKWEKI